MRLAPSSLTSSLRHWSLLQQFIISPLLWLLSGGMAGDTSMLFYNRLYNKYKYSNIMGSWEQPFLCCIDRIWILSTLFKLTSESLQHWDSMLFWLHTYCTKITFNFIIHLCCQKSRILSWACMTLILVANNIIRKKPRQARGEHAAFSVNPFSPINHNNDC